MRQIASILVLSSFFTIEERVGTSGVFAMYFGACFVGLIFCVMKIPDLANQRLGSQAYLVVDPQDEEER